MPKTPEIPKMESIGPEKEENLIKRIKNLFFEGLEAPELEVSEEGYVPEHPIRREEYFEESEEERRFKKRREEKIRNFKEGMGAFLETMDSSWLDDKTLTVLEKSRESLGLDIPKIVGFLNDLRELKKKK